MAAGASRALATRYARALLSVALDKKADVDRIDSELRELSSVLEEQGRLAEVLQAPTIPSAKRVAILEQVLRKEKLTDLTLNTMRLLTEKDRIAILRAVSEKFTRLLMEHNKVESGEVVSAHPLKSKQQRRLAENLGEALGKTMELSYRTDAGLVGGLVVRIGNRVYDASVATELQRFKERALAGL